MVTSRAVVGSSQMRISGSQARAMAMTMRWRMPPENWKGYWLNRFSASGMPTAFISSSARASAAALSIFLWRSTSVICLPTFMMGFSADMGS